jgi:uncharacterized protein with HEPN domain
MSDLTLALEILRQIEWSLQTIQKRFQPITSPDDFIATDEGLEKLDAICMQFIALGESLKNLDKVTAQTLLPRYPEIDWQKVKGMRDVISHHYFDLNAQVIHDTCANELDELSTVIQRMIDDLT